MTDREGIVPDLDENEYHSATGELSASGAKVLLHSPAKFHYQRTHRSEPTAAMLLGTATHSMILGAGQTFAPYDGSRATKATKEQVAEIEADGKTPISRREFDLAVGMADAVMSHKIAGKLFEEGQPEVSLFWTDEDTGVPCRGRADWLRPDMIVDLKTARDASRGGFERAALNLGYAIQNHWYVDGFAHTLGVELPFVFVVVESDPPHNVGVYDLDDDFYEYGGDKARRAREMFRDCTAANSWPDWPDEIAIQSLTLPRWAS